MIPMETIEHNMHDYSPARLLLSTYRVITNLFYER